MIEKFEVKNYQSHADSVFEFEKGLNVITGSSHNGKSAVVKALRWALTNKPRGVGFKSHFSKGETISKITFDDGWIMRTRGKVNTYESSNSDDPLNAIKTDIPELISDISKMNDINIQSQGDKYFLLQQSAGQRAKITNELVGLTVIDSAMSEINERIRRSTAHTKSLDLDIKDRKAELAEYPDIDAIEFLVAEIDSLVEDHQTLLYRQKALERLLEKISECNSTIETLDSWLEIEKDYNSIVKDLGTMEWRQEKQNSMVALVSNINDAKVKITKADKLIKLSGKADTLLHLLEEYFDLEKLDSQLCQLHSSYTTCSNMVDYQEKIIKVSKNKLSEHDICPMCAQQVEEWR